MGEPANPAEHIAVHTAPGLLAVEQLKAPLRGFARGAVEHTIAARIHIMPADETSCRKGALQNKQRAAQCLGNPLRML